MNPTTTTIKELARTYTGCLVALLIRLVYHDCNRPKNPPPSTIFLRLRSSIRRNPAQKTGLIVSATKRDETSTTITVFGRYDMKSPITSGMKTIGKKARQVVIVDAIIGQATSFAPSMAASVLVFPMVPCRKMFSTMTMPLSTSIPRARMRLKSTTMFSVIPIISRTKNDNNMENGIASDTKREFTKPRKKMVTIITSMNPVNILFSRSATICRTYRDWSEM